MASEFPPLDLSNLLNTQESAIQIRLLYEKALHALHAGDISGFERLVVELSIARPGAAEVLQLQVIVALAKRQPHRVFSATAELLKANPRDASAWFHLAQALDMVKDRARAIQAYDRFLLLQPNSAEGHMGRAAVWRALAEHGKADADVSEALRLEPDNTGALQERANGLLVAGAYDQAQVTLGELERRHPGSSLVACQRLFLARQLCDWLPQSVHLLPDEPTEAGALAQLRQRALQGEPALEPFASLILYDDPALHRRVAELWMQKLHPQVPVAPVKLSGLAGGRLHVAYVSSDCHKHATAYLLAGVLEQHDRSVVEVTLVSCGAPRQDAMRDRLMKAVDRWVDAHEKPDAEVAALCRELGVHVAVDLKGLTRDSRPDIFAHRAAPLQVNWLGYPGTMGTTYYDYLLADHVVVGEAQRRHFSEALAYLPHTYQPNDNRRGIDESSPSRAAHGLPEEGLVLCCFNNSFKFTPEVWALWMRLLAQTPGAVLWLLKTNDTSARHLREHARGLGVDPDRLLFAPVLDLPLHLARLRLADLSLDTLPCNAHTTASDALWAGVPHITCMGESFASRVGASLLQAVEMPELVTSSLQDYEKLALDLLKTPDRLRALRQQLEDTRHRVPLFDTARFARALESAFLAMHARQMRGLPPGDFDV